MVDWHRAEWQYRANIWAVRVLCACCLLQAPEVAWAIKYHFPWWDDCAEIITITTMIVARFIQKRTEMYRWDH